MKTLHPKQRKHKSRQNSSMYSDDLLEQASTILEAPRQRKKSKAIYEQWDFDLENDFRGPPTLPDHAAARAHVDRIAAVYRDALAREVKAETLTQSLKKYQKIAKQADLLARSIRNLTVDEYRALHIAEEFEEIQRFEGLCKDYFVLKDLLFPDNWIGADNEKRQSSLSKHEDTISRFFSQVPIAFSVKHGFSLDFPDPGGKTKSVHLLAPSARWRLLHVSWQTFAALPHLDPSTTREGPFDVFVKSIHEAVTAQPGSFVRDMGADGENYVGRRHTYDQHVATLKAIGARFGWSTFQEMEDVLISRTRRPAAMLTPKYRDRLISECNQYIRERNELLLGPGIAKKSRPRTRQK